MENIILRSKLVYIGGNMRRAFLPRKIGHATQKERERDVGFSRLWAQAKSIFCRQNQINIYSRNANRSKGSFVDSHQPGALFMH